MLDSVLTKIIIIYFSCLIDESVAHNWKATIIIGGVFWLVGFGMPVEDHTPLKFFLFVQQA